MKWFITGSNGQVGTLASIYLRSRGVEVLGLTSKELDVSNYDEVYRSIKLHRPDYVLNAAAWTNVEGAEIHFKKAFEANSVGPRNLALATKEFQSKLIHISTDYIFDGKERSPIRESHIASPLNKYGETKAQGEINVMEHNPNRSLILRTSWLYSEIGKNFAKTIIKKALSSDEEIFVVNDQFGQPTLVNELVAKIFEIATNDCGFGTFNLTNTGSASWFDFAQAILEKTNLGPERVKPISSKSLESLVTRPRYTVLSHSKLQEIGVLPMREWKDSVRDSVSEIKRRIEEEIGV